MRDSSSLVLALLGVKAAVQQSLMAGIVKFESGKILLEVTQVMTAQESRLR